MTNLSPTPKAPCLAVLVAIFSTSVCMDNVDWSYAPGPGALVPELPHLKIDKSSMRQHLPAASLVVWWPSSPSLPGPGAHVLKLPPFVDHIQDAIRKLASIVCQLDVLLPWYMCYQMCSCQVCPKQQCWLALSFRGRGRGRAKGRGRGRGRGPTPKCG